MRKLIGSAATLEELLELTIQFFCGTPIEFKSTDTKRWDIYNSSGKIKGIRAVQKGKRFRLERAENESN